MRACYLTMHRMLEWAFGCGIQYLDYSILHLDLMAWHSN